MRLSGGIGENAAPIRSKILSEMGYGGIELDEQKNAQLNDGTKVSSDTSKVEVHVIPTNEELVIAIDAAKIATASKQTPWA